MYRLKTKPWEHQIKALDFLMMGNFGALYTDMGSGKTKIMLDLIENRELYNILIVTTKKSCDEWVNQIQIHSNIPEKNVFQLFKLSTTDKVLLLRKKSNTRENRRQKTIYLCNYDSVWRKPFGDELKKIGLDCVICDESHRIKSPGSKVSLFLSSLGKMVQNRYIMTGTPTTESPADVYAQYRFLEPSIFGTNYHNFCNEYMNIDGYMSRKVGYTVLNKTRPYKNLDILHNKMFQCAFYMEPSLTLPDTELIDIKFMPDAQVIQAYKELSDDGILIEKADILEINNILALYTRLQQVLSGYLDFETPDFLGKVRKEYPNERAKTLKKLIKRILKKSEKEKIVVFAKYRYDFQQIQDITGFLGLNYGEISGKKNQYSDWKQGKIDLLAVQFQSGSESISLVESCHLIYYNLPYSYGLYRQSMKRVHRPGQTRNVTYYRIIGKIPGETSVDERIIDAITEKKDLAEYLIHLKK